MGRQVGAGLQPQLCWAGVHHRLCLVRNRAVGWLDILGLLAAAMVVSVR